MGIKNKRKLKKLDLLEMPNPERIKLIREVRENFDKKWQKQSYGNHCLKLKTWPLTET
jgi:hypothetical protein